MGLMDSLKRMFGGGSNDSADMGQADSSPMENSVPAPEATPEQPAAPQAPAADAGNMGGEMNADMGGQPTDGSTPMA